MIISDRVRKTRSERAKKIGLYNYGMVGWWAKIGRAERSAGVRVCGVDMTDITKMAHSIDKALCYYEKTNGELHLSELLHRDEFMEIDLEEEI